MWRLASYSTCALTRRRRGAIVDGRATAVGPTNRFLEGPVVDGPATRFVEEHLVDGPATRFVQGPSFMLPEVPDAVIVYNGVY